MGVQLLHNILSPKGHLLSPDMQALSDTWECVANNTFTAEGAGRITLWNWMRSMNKVIGNVLVIPGHSDREVFEDLRRIVVMKKHTIILENYLLDGNMKRTVCKNQRHSVQCFWFRWLKNRLCQAT